MLGLGLMRTRNVRRRQSQAYLRTLRNHGPLAPSWDSVVKAPLSVRKRVLHPYWKDRIERMVRDAYLQVLDESIERHIPDFQVLCPNGLMDDSPEEFWSSCPACGNPIDYCPGHGSGRGHAILMKHDDGDHSECNIFGCENASVPQTRSIVNVNLPD